MESKEREMNAEKTIEPSIQSTGLGHSPGQDSKGPGEGVAGVKKDSTGLKTKEAEDHPADRKSTGTEDNEADIDLATNDDAEDAAETP